MPRVVHFEVAADEPERALKFYADVFGWRAQKWEGPFEYWLVDTGNGIEGQQQPGINGGITRRCAEEKMVNHVNTVDVPSLEEYVSKIEASGGKIVAPKMAVPGIGYMAYCQDTEGNVFGIMQEDAAAN